MTFIYYLQSVVCLVCPVLPVSLDCPFLIAPSGFSNVYLLSRDCPISCVPSVSGLYIFDYIASSVFSNVYSLPRVCPMSCVPSVVSVSGLPPRFSMTFIYYLEFVVCLVYPVLPVSLDCPYLIASSVLFQRVFTT